jgi:hypothetical protein
MLHFDPSFLVKLLLVQSLLMFSLGSAQVRSSQSLLQNLIKNSLTSISKSLKKEKIYRAECARAKMGITYVANLARRAKLWVTFAIQTCVLGLVNIL